MNPEHLQGNDKGKSDFLLQNRLIKAMQPKNLYRRKFGPIEPIHLPNPTINPSGVSSEEMFTLMVESLQEHRAIRNRLDANKAQANGLRAADYFVDELLENKQTFIFAADVINLIAQHNPALEDYIQKVIQSAIKRGAIRQERRQELFRRWYGEQKRLGKL